MPEAAFLFEWSAKRGIVLLGKYPEDAPIDVEMLADSLGMIILRERRPGFFAVPIRGKKLVCYCSGPDRFSTFGVLLDAKDDERPYRGALVRLITRMLKTGEIPATLEEWERVWHYINAFPEMAQEQRLGDAFCDPEVRMAHSLAVESGVIPLDEFVDTLKSHFQEVTRDVLTSFIYTLIALGVFGAEYDSRTLTEYIYLLRDVVFYRAAPPKYKEIASRIPEFETDYRTFATTYIETGWEQDQSRLPPILANHETYRVLCEFRRRGVIPRDEIPAEWEEPLKKLMDLEIVKESGDLLYQFVDVRVALLFPRYTIRRVLERVKAGELRPERAIAYLETLRRSYLR